MRTEHCLGFHGLKPTGTAPLERTGSVTRKSWTGGPWILVHDFSLDLKWPFLLKDFCLGQGWSFISRFFPNLDRSDFGPWILDFGNWNDFELKLNRKRKHVLGIYLQSLVSNCSEQLSFVCEEQKLGWDPYYRLIYSIFCDPSRFVNLYGFINWSFVHFWSVLVKIKVQCVSKIYKMSSIQNISFLFETRLTFVRRSD